MSIEINSFEYQCWHEVGHAVTCLRLGGEVEFIEFLGDETHKSLARARCKTTPDIRPFVLCGGFAAEHVLLRHGLLGQVDEREFTQIIFKNASIDREMYFGVGSNVEFTKEEDTKFMNFAIKSVSPIIVPDLGKMHDIVSILQEKKRIDGAEIKNILDIDSGLALPN